MAIDAGKLRHRVRLERNAPSQDSKTGELVDDWVEYGKAWAAIEPLSARDLIAAQAAQSKVTARIVMRRRDDLRPEHRIVHKQTVYKIAGILVDPDSGLEYVTVPVSAGVLTSSEGANGTPYVDQAGRRYADESGAVYVADNGR